MAKLAQVLACVLVGFAALVASSPTSKDDRMPISVVLPKLQAIYEDIKTLSLKNAELRAKILEAESKAPTMVGAQPAAHHLAQPQQQFLRPPAGTIGVPSKPQQSYLNNERRVINYEELKQFNIWVDSNLEYARTNLLASTETLKDEAEANNGTIIYSDQAIKDGIEGVKYWRSAIIFQDKTLNNEKFDIEEFDSKEKVVASTN